MRIRRGLACGIGFVIASAAGLSAEGADPRRPEFGVDREAVLVVTPWDAQPSSSSVTWDFTVTGARRYRTGGTGGLIAAVRIPDGAVLTSFDADVCDQTTMGEVHITLLADGSGLASLHTGGPEMPGCGRVSANVAPVTIDNANQTYLLTLENTTLNGTTTIGPIRIGYKLQVSDGPVLPTFLDVPTSDPAYDYVEALVASGITAGCGGANYCPDATLTRRQMAVFLAKALGLQWPVLD